MSSSQSLSTPSHTSDTRGLTPARASSQSVPQLSPLQHSASGSPSRSLSRIPNVLASQSSSWSSTSQTSALLGKRFGSPSAQSSPPHAMLRRPSPSISPPLGPSQSTGAHSSRASTQTSV